MTIQELREKRSTTWNAAKAFLDSRRTDSGVLSVDDDATYTKMEQEIADLGKEIARQERLEAIDREMAQPISKPITDKPDGDKPATASRRATSEYKADFAAMLRGKPVLHNALYEGKDENGGYLVPEEFERQVIVGLTENNVIRQIAKVVTTEADRKIPVAATHTEAKWTKELGLYTPMDPTFSQVTLDAFKLTDLIKVSVELLQDAAFDLEGYIVQEFTRAFGEAEEKAFCVGTGEGEPTGIFAPAAEEKTSTAELTSDAVIDLVYSLKQPYRRKAVFLTNDATVGKIRKLVDGNGQYLWQPGIQAGEPDKLLGYSLYTSTFVPTDGKVMAFGDFSNYWIADRMGLTVQRLNELYSTSGQVGFIATERVDGKIVLAEGIQILDLGGNKKAKV